MLRKKVLCLLAASSCSIGLASAANTNNYFNGFYAGLGGGLVSSSAHTTVSNELSLSANDYEFFPIDITTREATNYDVTGTGELFAGYGKTFNDKFYFGLELFGKLTPNVEMSTDSTSLTTELYSDGVDSLESTTSISNYSFGGDLRFGYLITPKIMTYVLLGTNVAEIENETTYRGVPSEDGSFDGVLSSSSSNWKAGLTPGIGIEGMVTDKLSVRAQFAYTYWGDSCLDISDSHKGQNDSFAYETSLSGSVDDLQRGELTVDVIYHF